MKIKPLPCPFCGKIPKFHRVPQEVAEPELNAFWSLSCGDRRNYCPGNASAHGDKKADAVAEWNKRKPADVAQFPLTPLDKPPFVARCGTLLLLVDELDDSFAEGFTILRGVILEGVYFNDNGNYGFGDRVSIGPITPHWRRISTNPDGRFSCSECFKRFHSVEETLIHKSQNH